MAEAKIGYTAKTLVKMSELPRPQGGASKDLKQL
jgi:hypothetical protein